MRTYIALLRGVNVGGKNHVSMPALKEALEKAGLSEVLTYINSGNIIFSSEKEDVLLLQQICQRAIADTFQLDIPVAVISADNLTAAVEGASSWWDEKRDSKHNAIIVIAPAKAEDVMAAVGAVKPGYEQIACQGQVIFWSAPLATYSRTSWSKVSKTSAYGSITIRNANTAKKLAKLVKS